MIGLERWPTAMTEKLLVTGSKDGFVCIWEAESAELAAKIGPMKGEGLIGMF